MVSLGPVKIEISDDAARILGDIAGTLGNLTDALAAHAAELKRYNDATAPVELVEIASWGKESTLRSGRLNTALCDLCEEQEMAHIKEQDPENEACYRLRCPLNPCENGVDCDVHPPTYFYREII